MHSVTTYRKEYNRLCDLVVEIGTNAPKPDYEHRDTRTVFKLWCNGHLKGAIDEGSQEYIRSVTLTFQGNDEAACLADALEFAAVVLRRRMPGSLEDAEQFTIDLK